MAFNIQELKSTVAKYGGLASTNKFMARITLPTGARAYLPDISTRELSLFCDAGTLPGKNVRALDIKRQAYGDIYRMPIAKENKSVGLSFFVDSQYQIMKFFHSWIGFIVEDGNETPNSIMDRQRSYREVAYLEDYASTLELFGYSDSGEDQGIKFSLYNAYPVQVGDVQVGWEQNDQIMRIPVEFNFTHFTTELIGSPNPRQFVPQGIGFFTRIAQIASLAGVISNIKQPRNIQDLINNVSRVQTVLRSF